MKDKTATTALVRVTCNLQTGKTTIQECRDHKFEKHWGEPYFCIWCHTPPSPKDNPEYFHV